MQIKAEEISSIIRQQIAGYETEINIQEVGTVISVGDGVARIYGLERCMALELVEFPGNVFGVALNLEEDNVGAVLLSDSTLVKEGDMVKRTERVIQVPVGEALIGRVVNPRGAAGQVEGAFAQGIGLAVSEHLVINEASGTVENALFGDYKIPTTLDVPLSRVGFAEGDESLQSEMKGVSETTMNSPAAAIANAVYDAVGVRIHALPITPEKILEGLRGRSG